MNNNEQNFNNLQNPINNIQVPTNDIQNQVMEPVPPVLTPIAPLASAEVNQAPTLDALGPMNVMPNELPSNNIDNSNINLGSQPMSPEPAPIAPEAAPIVPEAAPIAPEPAPIAPKSAPIAPEPTPIDPEAAPVAPETAPIAPETAPAQPVNISSPVVEDYEINQNVNLGVSPTQPEVTPVDTPNNIEIQDTSLNNSTSDVQDLGLDPNYTDELELMDIDQEDNQKLETSDSDDVDEIKALIDKLKEKGSKIELQEFDFDKIYQLIVKIEK